MGEAPKRPKEFCFDKEGNHRLVLLGDRNPDGWVTTTFTKPGLRALYLGNDQHHNDDGQGPARTDCCCRGLMLPFDLKATINSQKSSEVLQAMQCASLGCEGKMEVMGLRPRALEP
jgi:hypothetical protein